MNRDEFSCCCCGAETDSTVCEACAAFGCDERTTEEIDAVGCLVPRNVTVNRARHAAHYEGGGGHDLLTATIVMPAGRETLYSRRGEPDARPLGLGREWEYHSGSRETDGRQRYRYVKRAPLDMGTCERCRK